MASSQFGVAAAVLITCLATTGCAPAPTDPETAVSESVSLADYQRAESFLGANTADLVTNSIQALHWQQDDRLVYRMSTERGSEFILADPATESKTTLLDTDRLLAALAEYSEEELDASDLSLSSIELSRELESIQFDFEDDEYVLDLNSYALDKLCIDLYVILILFATI